MIDNLSPNQRSAIKRAERNPELRPLLFRKAKGLKWFRAFEEAGFLDASSIPAPKSAKQEGYVTIPTWPIAQYLASASEELEEKDDAELVDKFLDFVSSATEHAVAHEFGNYRVWWNFATILSNCPSDLITEKYLGYVDYWLQDRFERGILAQQIGEDWFVRLIRQNTESSIGLAMKLLDLLYKVEIIDDKSGRPPKAVLRFETWNAEKLTEKTAHLAGSTIGIPAVEFYRQRLAKTVSELGIDRLSTIWRPAIEDHEQNLSTSDAEDILLTGFRDALLGLVEFSDRESVDYISGLFDCDSYVIRRVAIYVVRKKFHFLSSVVDKFLREDYFTYHYQHELWTFLNECFGKLDNYQKDGAKRIILSLKESDEKGVVHEAATAYRRAVWLSSIRKHDEEAESLYSEAIIKTGSEPDHPDFSSYMSVGWVKEEAPFSEEDLASCDIDELINRLNTYQDLPSQDGTTVEALVRSVRQVFKSNPLHFYESLPDLSGLRLPFLSGIIEAFTELWSEQAKLPWDDVVASVLELCEAVLVQDRVWSHSDIKNGAGDEEYCSRLIGNISRFIEKGVRSDEFAFAPSLLNNAEIILRRILDKQPAREFEVDSDAVSVSINSARGQSLEAFINLALRQCRLERDQHGSHEDSWKKYASFFQNQLDSGKDYEFITLLTTYLPNFYFMSRSWVVSNLTKIFSRENYQHWLCAMQGYSYVGSLIKEVYQFLAEDGSFSYALNDEYLGSRVRDRIVENVVVAYINGYESIDDQDGMIAFLVKRQVYGEISHLIWFVWTLRRKDRDHLQSKVLSLWAELVSNLSLETEEGRKLASRLCDWSVYIDSIDENTEPLIFYVAPYADDDFHSTDLLKSIARLSRSQPDKASELWLRVLERSFPIFPKKEFKEALENVAQVGPDGMRKAKKIAERYMIAGIDDPRLWLRDIGASQNK
ncbi:hypothetical protein [Marinobacter nauticus]|uniref:hypothetical protein n=1 Tax=Marinobacter nauticus TaxID=2743 RepID=UPI004044F39F